MWSGGGAGTPPLLVQTGWVLPQSCAVRVVGLVRHTVHVLCCGTGLS